jgi:hypothetical protein
VTTVVEMQPGCFFCGIWEQGYGLVYRQGLPAQKVMYPSASEGQCTDVIPVPNFDVERNPFLFVRTNQAVNLVDVAQLNSTLLLKMPNQAHSYQKMKLHFDDPDYRLLLTNKSGSVLSIDIDRNLLNDLRHLGSN